jgi:hypothetical protein
MKEKPYGQQQQQQQQQCVCETVAEFDSNAAQKT